MGYILFDSRGRPFEAGADGDVSFTAATLRDNGRERGWDCGVAGGAQVGGR